MKKYTKVNEGPFSVLPKNMKIKTVTIILFLIFIPTSIQAQASWSNAIRFTLYYKDKVILPKDFKNKSIEVLSFNTKFNSLFYDSVDKCYVFSQHSPMSSYSFCIKTSQDTMIIYFPTFDIDLGRVDISSGIYDIIEPNIWNNSKVQAFYKIPKNINEYKTNDTYYKDSIDIERFKRLDVLNLKFRTE